MTVTIRPTDLEPRRVPHPAGCDGYEGACARIGCYDVVVPVTLLLSEHNAAVVFGAMGLACAGRVILDAEDLRGRCLLAIALADDAPVSPVTRGLLAGVGLDMARKRGYMSERLGAVLAIAEQAAAAGTTVSVATG